MALDLSGLDPEQRSAVTAPPEPTLVIAGAGSGKTAILTHRVAWMIEQGTVDPEHYFVSTFTKAAATEIRDRIMTLVQRPGLTVATTHSLMFRLLNARRKEMGEKRLDICKDHERTRILRDLFGTKTAEFPQALNIDVDIATVGNIISNAKNALIHCDDTWVTEVLDANLPLDHPQRAAALAYPLYEAHLDSVGKLDFDDMLLDAYDLLSTDTGWLNRARRRWQAFCLDESQDLNTAQFSILSLLAPATDAPNITVVGDHRQCVYGFRGAKPDLFESFDRRYPGARRIDLVRNYRSTPQVVAVANKLMGEHTAQEAQRSVGPAARVVPFESQLEQAAEIARFVGEAKTKGFRGGDVAILVRTNAQSAGIERAFTAANLPYWCAGGGFFNRMEVADLMAYLRLASTRTDERALRRIINRPTRYLGGAYCDEVAKHAPEYGGDLVDTMERTYTIRGRQLSAKQRIAADELAQILGMIQVMSPPSAIQAVVDYSGYLEWLARNEGSAMDADDSRADNIDALLEVAAGFTSLADLLDFADASSKLQQDNPDATEISTVHRSKGRQWAIVIVSNFYEGSFPHKKAVESGDVEEERRIAYVAMTRAQNSLILTVPPEDTFNHPVEPSRFLERTGLAMPTDILDDWWGDALRPVLSQNEVISTLVNLEKGLR